MFCKVIQTGGSELDKLTRRVDALTDKIDALETREERQKMLDEYRKYVTEAEGKSWTLTTECSHFYKNYPWIYSIPISEFKIIMNEAIVAYHNNKCKAKKK